MADGLQVVPPRLLLAQMGGERRIPCGTCQVLTLYERNVLALRILVALSESKINDVNIVPCCVGSNQEIVRLDVSMDDSLLVHLFNSFDHLLCD